MIKEEDLRALDDIGDPDLIDFALGNNGDYNNADEELWSPKPPKPKKEPTPSSKKWIEKPRQCDKVKIQIIIRELLGYSIRQNIRKNLLGIMSLLKHQFSFEH